MDDMEFETEDAMIGYLVEQGAMTIAGVTEDGEITYNMVPEVLQEVFPELYESFMGEIEGAVLTLVEEGYVNVDYDENLKPWFSLTKEGERAVEALGGSFFLEPPDGHS